MDIGNSFLWGIHYWQCRNEMSEHKSLFHISIGFGSMGWAIGAAVGVAIAAREKPVVCFTGDGSLLMNGQEITTALEENLNILFVILNDSALGTVKHGQRLANAERTAYGLPKINFAAIAKAMGVRAYRIESIDELNKANISDLMQQQGPCLLDVVIDGEQMPPLGVRMKSLGTVKNSGELESPTVALPEEPQQKSPPKEVVYSRVWVR